MFNKATLIATTTLCVFFSFEARSEVMTICQKKYSSYFKKLKNVENLYKQKKFEKLHYTAREDFVKTHLLYSKDCLDSNPRIKSDILYGDQFFKSITTSYERVLKKYGFSYLLNEETEKELVEQEFEVIPKTRLYVEKKETIASILSHSIIPKSPLLKLGLTDLSHLIKEQARMISLIERVEKTKTVRDLVIKKINTINKKDSLKELEEDVLIIEVY